MLFYPKECLPYLHLPHMVIQLTHWMVQMSIDDDNITVGSIFKLNHLDVPHSAQVQHLGGENTELV